MSELEKKIQDELFNKLKGIRNNKDFVLGVFTNAQHPEDRQAIIDFIDKGDDVSPANILALSVLLDDAREKPRLIKNPT